MQVAPLRFQLDTQFVNTYAARRAPFGFGALGELVYLSKYSRIKDDGFNERWFETVERVVNGTYSMQLRWILQQGLAWDPGKAQASAQEMYDLIYHMKFMPPGRGLWAMGSAITEERGLFAALNNCAFVSTDHQKYDLADPYTFLMDSSMLGIGTGFDTKGAGQLRLRKPLHTAPFVIPDSREGWVESLRRLMLAYMDRQPLPVFDYSRIRGPGEPILGFGGVSAGPEPLREMHAILQDKVLGVGVDKDLSVTAIVDIMNLVGKCVVAGNLRRTAEIAFGEPDSDEFMDLKNPAVNPERTNRQNGWAWTSNNSVLANIGMAYGPAAQRVSINGEPGFAWLDNMRHYRRMGDPRGEHDVRVKGGNPCLEQSLESYELCCLVETFPNNHDSIEEYQRTLKFAYLYGKTVTLGKTHWPRTNAVMLRNRRIGLSQSGIVQAIEKFGIEPYRQLCEVGYATVQQYDATYSEWFAIPRSIKTTSVKPSGTVSLLAGATPGMHFPEYTTYIRRMRLSKLSTLIAPLRAAGYTVEDCDGDPSSYVVEVPVKMDQQVRNVKDVSMWEQLSLAAFLQKHWADNQVSATVTFNPATEGPQIAPALDYFQYQLKGISFLPRPDLWKEGAEAPFAQMPYETISEERYVEMSSRLLPVDFSASQEANQMEQGCSNDICELPQQ